MSEEAAQGWIKRLRQWLMPMPWRRPGIENELLESEARFRKLFEDSADATLIIENNAFIDCNRAALTMLRLASVSQIRSVHPVAISPELQPDGRNSAEKAEEMIAQAFCHGSNLFEWEHLRADGEHFMAEVSLTPIFHHDRKLLHVVWRDITERKQMEKAISEEQGRYKTLFETANDGIFLMDGQGYLDCNQKGADMYDRTVAEVIGHTPIEFSPERQPDGRLSTAVSQEKTLAALSGKAQHFDWQSLRRDGTPFDVEITLSRIVLSGKTCMQAIVRDITERKRAEEQLRLAHEAFTNVQEAIIVCDVQGTILDVNPAFSQVTGYSREDAIGSNPRILKSGQHPSDFYADMWQHLAVAGRWEGEIWNRRKDGQLYIQHTRIGAVRDNEEHITRYVAVASDVTQLRESQSRIERMAYYDALTNLPNRALLADRLKQAIAQADRRNDLLAVCYLDLDGFKPINDLWGHDAGDQLLMEVARRLQSCVRMGDTVARLGGDEFVVLLGDASDVHEIEQAVRRILAAVAEPFSIGTASAALTASIGVTVYPDDGQDPDTLIRHADQAMYISKQSGKNRHNLFDPESDRRLKAHHEIVTRIRDGLSDGELLLFYQPKVDMRLGKVVGVEALIRWQHPEQGLLPPAKFLPVIENSDFSIVLGEWVMHEAMRQMAVWAGLGLELPVSVNISGHHLQQKNFVARLADLLALFPEVQPQWLELEILETTAMDDVEETSRVISACSELGVSFALDDFGTGYSSLTYFRRLPTKLLKIDQSFVRDMLDDPEDLAIVEGVISLAKAFQRKIIAEGVETEGHGAPLLDIGCDLAQGYAIARPMRAEEIPLWVEKWRAPIAWDKARGI